MSYCIKWNLLLTRYFTFLWFQTTFVINGYQTSYCIISMNLLKKFVVITSCTVNIWSVKLYTKSAQSSSGNTLKVLLFYTSQLFLVYWRHFHIKVFVAFNVVFSHYPFHLLRFCSKFYLKIFYCSSNIWLVLFHSVGVITVLGHNVGLGLCTTIKRVLQLWAGFSLWKGAWLHEADW